MTSFVTDSPPPNLQSIGEFSAAQELGLDFREPQGVNYLEAPLGVYRCNISGLDRFDVEVNHTPLHGQEMVNFLGKIANNRFGVSLYGVISDWNIVDRADGSGGYADSLVSLHENMGRPWREFMESRGRLLAVANDDQIPYDFHASSSPSGIFIKGRDNTAEKLSSELNKHDMSIFKELVKCLDEEGFENAEEFVFQQIALDVNQRRNPPVKGRLAIESAFASGSAKRRQKVLGTIFAGLSPDLRIIAGDKLFGIFYDAVMDDENHTYYAPKNKLDRDKGISRFSKRIGNFAAEFVTINFVDGDSRTFLKHGTVRRVAEGLTVAPLLSWTRDEQGRRQFVIERRLEHENEKIIFGDGVMGVLLAAYYSPKITAEWPSQMGIRGSKRQFIGAAQIPVMALMHQRELLKSDFIEAAESVAV